MVAKKDSDASVLDAAAVDVQYTPLKTFADHNVEMYGIEIMAGFYHEQEVGKHYADTLENWHNRMNEFKGREVK